MSSDSSEKHQIEAPVNGGRNYNGPKVRSRAHAASNVSECIRLYAGNSGGSGGTRKTSDNPTGADNQQERLRLNEPQNPQRPYAGRPVSSTGG